ncbi:MAG: methanogenesis marker 17 protein [Candidatus Nezhaarchaeota archaeon]|nr:methanogenesis marker 17 protein [Candidatus Nezhaarchaeota archaeon]
MKVNIKMEDEAASLFRDLINDLIVDLNISGILDSIDVFLDPNKTLFAMSVKTKPALRSIRLSDVAEVSSTNHELRVKINDERFSPLVVKVLEEKYGDSVKHVSRLEVIVSRPIKEEELKDLPLCSYVEASEGLLMDFVQKIVPEGFRSLKILKNGNALLIIASEDPLTEDVEVEIGSISSVFCSSFP